MVTVSVASPDAFQAREGEAVSLVFSITGTNEPLDFDLRLVYDTADETDIVAPFETTSFVPIEPIPDARKLFVQFETVKDRVDEVTETFALAVSLEGAVFQSGSATESFTVSILDDIEQHGSNGADRFKGAATQDIYNGYGGRDVIKGLGGDDTLKGGGGKDRVVGGAGDDRVEGNAGNDKLAGGGGADFLAGSKGADTLNGGKGRDVLVGQAGDDVFVFSKGRDVIRDFDKKGDDVINLRKVKSIDDFDDLLDNHLTFDSGNAFISDLKGNKLKLNNTSLDSLSADDFLF
ncbi:MAG: calcium-binding protein [Arenibacterium sp.]